jgi:hypothetical protein
MVSRLVDSGHLGSLLDSFKNNSYPLSQHTFELLMQLVGTISNMEKGRELVKFTGITSWCLEPKELDDYSIKYMTLATLCPQV